MKYSTLKLLLIGIMLMPVVFVFAQNDPPTNLVASLIEPDDVELTWDAPGGEWIQWDTKIQAGALGLVNGGTLYIASHWEPDDLTPYDGKTISKIQFFPNEDPDAGFEIRVCTGPNAGTLVSSVVVTDYAVNEFNEVVLPTPVTIDASIELWFGCKITCNPNTQPAGTDDGPAVPTKGDMLSFDGTDWFSAFNTIGMDRNFNLAAFVESTDGISSASLMVKTENTIVEIKNTIVETELIPLLSIDNSGTGKKFNPVSGKDLLGYNVYQNGIFVEFTTEIYYLDEDLVPGYYEYFVTALYDEGESDPSNTASVIIYDPLNPCFDFEYLTVGGGVAEQMGGYWTTWTGSLLEDATIVDDYSNSPNNSFVVDDGIVNLVFQLGDNAISTEQWAYSHYMYVPTGHSGYFNVQNDPIPGVGWNLDLYFDDDGTGSFAGQSTETYTYTPDTWFLVEINYDFESGLGEVLFDGVAITQFINEDPIGSIDYFGSSAGGTPGAYYDDVCFGEGWIITGIKENLIDNTQVYPNPATDIVNIKAESDIDFIRVYNYAGQLVAEEEVNNVVYRFNTSQFNPGLYIFLIENTKGTIKKRIIIE